MTNLLIDTIQLKLAGTAAWRRGLAARFDDPRNTRAADRLDAFAATDHRTIASNTLAALERYTGSKALLDAANEAARDVEFRRRPETLDDLLKAVVAKLGTTGDAR